MRHYGFGLTFGFLEHVLHLYVQINLFYILVFKYTLEFLTKLLYLSHFGSIFATFSNSNTFFESRERLSTCNRFESTFGFLNMFCTCMTSTNQFMLHTRVSNPLSNYRQSAILVKNLDQFSLHSSFQIHL